MAKVEYRVREAKRFIVTRYEESDGGRTGSCVQKGTYDSAELAHEVAYALCRHEHQLSGEPVGSMAFIYPDPSRTAGTP